MYQFQKNVKKRIKMYETVRTPSDFGGFKDNGESLFYEGIAFVVIGRDSPMMPEDVPDGIDGMVLFNRYDSTLDMDKIQTGVRVEVQGTSYEIKHPAPSYYTAYLRDMN